MERKTLLYKTGVEYGDYTINHVQGCSHGCLYPCYAYMMARRFGRAKCYKDWLNPVLVSNAKELLLKELPKYKHRITSVHLCFTTDPFMYGYPEIQKASLELIEILNDHGIPCTALSKGLLPMELANLSPDNQYGITLISLDERFRQQMEPGAAPYTERIDRLKKLHEAGCATWVSIEPYPTPNIIEQDFTEILNAISFTNKIIFGRLNYNKLVTAYPGYQEYYNKLVDQTIEFCDHHGIDYHIKEGTQTVSVQKQE
jgi:DNA repair photolyase